MGTVYAEIIVKNTVDVEKAHEGLIAENQIRQVTLTALVDTGATTLMISEETFKQLGLRAEETKDINIAGGGTLRDKVTSPVKIHWKDRSVTINAIALPGNRTLLGLVPLEMMDLIPDPMRHQLVGAHGDKVEFMAL